MSAAPLPWIWPAAVHVPESLSAAAGGHPLVAQTLARRGILDPAAAAAFLDPAAYAPAPPEALPGMERAVKRLARAIRGREPICVWGDFDVDGQTSTALLVAALSDLGAPVTYHVPVRAAESHGVSLPVLARILDEGARVVLTCDTGIGAAEAVAYARDRGVDMVITDHHELPPELPDAAAVVNPRLLPAGHPLADLSGAGVAYKLAEALYAWARRPGEAEQFADLAALGIIADLALLRADTRWLAQVGLARLRRSVRPGLAALLERAGLDPAQLSEEHIGFVLAPRLNAAGRLADANPCVALLALDREQAADPAAVAQARILAQDLEALNARRKLLCDQVERAAEAQIARDPSLLEHAALVVAGPDWPAGIVGLVAARLAGRYGRPAAVIAAPAGGPVAAGSARSVEGIHITAALAANAGLLLGYGGHPMAAGFSLPVERIPDLRRGLARAVAAMAADAQAAPGLDVDAVLPLGKLTIELVDDLARLAPFGPGNRPLVLVAERLSMRSSQAVGRNDEHRLVVLADEAGREQRVIWWDGGSESLPSGLVDLAYTVRASTYRGERGLQVEWIASRPSPGAAVVEVPAAVPVEAVDRRGDPDPRAELARLLAEGGVAVWREGEAAAGAPGSDRWGLAPAGALAIWTAPPGPVELAAALAAVGPARVVLFGLPPGASDPAGFMARLAGLVKHARRAYEGRTSLAALAAATAQRAATVRLGLALLEAAGHVAVAEADDDGILLAGAQAPADPARQAELAARLEAALAETAAYRAYFRTADAAVLLRQAAAAA